MRAYFLACCLLINFHHPALSSQPCEGADVLNADAHLMSSDGPCRGEIDDIEEALHWHNFQIHTTTEDLDKAAEEFKRKVCAVGSSAYHAAAECFQVNYPLCWTWPALRQTGSFFSPNATNLKLIYIISNDNLCSDDATLEAYWKVRYCNRGPRMLSNILAMTSCQAKGSTDYSRSQLPTWYKDAAEYAVATHCIETQPGRSSRYKYNITKSMGLVLACSGYGRLSGQDCQPYMRHLANMWLSQTENDAVNQTISHTLEVELLPSVIEPMVSASGTLNTAHECSSLRDGSKARENDANSLVLAPTSKVLPFMLINVLMLTFLLL